MKRSIWVTILGIINIIVGLLVIKFFSLTLVAFYLSYLPFLLIYIGAGPMLLWGGIEILRRKKYSKKLIIVSALIIIVGVTMDLLNSLFFLISMKLWEDFGTIIDHYGKGPFYLLLSFLIYAILLLIFFTRLKVKRMFDKEVKK